MDLIVCGSDPVVKRCEIPLPGCGVWIPVGQNGTLDYSLIDNFDFLTCVKKDHYCPGNETFRAYTTVNGVFRELPLGHHGWTISFEGTRQLGQRAYLSCVKEENYFYSYGALEVVCTADDYGNGVWRTPYGKPVMDLYCYNVLPAAATEDRLANYFD